MTGLRLKVEVEVYADVSSEGSVKHIRGPHYADLDNAVSARYPRESLRELVAEASRCRLDEGLVRVCVGRSRDVEYHRLARTTATQIVLISPHGSEDKWMRRTGLRRVDVWSLSSPRIHTDDLRALNERKKSR